MARKAFWFLLDAIVEAPAWALLLIGAALLSVSMLVGPYMENHRLAWQRDLIRLQLQRLSEQEDAYQQLLLSLDRDDPVLIQRLAYHYLKLKPAGTESIANPDNHRKPAGVLGAAYGKPGGPVPQPLAESMNNVDTWLYRPMPVVGKDFPAYSMSQTLLTKMVTGPARPVVAGIGGLLIAVGLIPMGGWPRKGTQAIERVISRPIERQAAMASPEPTSTAWPSATIHGNSAPRLLTPSRQDSTDRVETPSETISISPPPPPPSSPSDVLSPTNGRSTPLGDAQSDGGPLIEDNPSDGTG